MIHRGILCPACGVCRKTPAAECRCLPAGAGVVSRGAGAKPLVHHITIPSKILTCSMERQQVHVMWIVVRLCEASPPFNVPASPAPAPGPGAIVTIPREGRIQERKPTRRLALQALPRHLDRGRCTPVGVGQTGGGFFLLPHKSTQDTEEQRREAPRLPKGRCPHGK